MRLRIPAALAIAALLLPTTLSAQFESERIEVLARGAGPDIILIPGLGSHRNVWRTVAESLAHRYRLHLVQIRGFGGFPPEANAQGPVSAPVAVEIARYIQQNELDKPTLIGHSMGGVIAMMVAARYPDRVGRLMVVDEPPWIGIFFGGPEVPPDELRTAADEARVRILADSAGSPDGMLERMFAGMTNVDSLKPMLLRSLAESDRQTVANAFHELIITDLRPELHRIDAPIVALYAPPQGDEAAREEFERQHRALWENARNIRLVPVEDSAHFIQLDQPARFIAEVDALMQLPVR